MYAYFLEKPIKYVWSSNCSTFACFASFTPFDLLSVVRVVIKWQKKDSKLGFLACFDLDDSRVFLFLDGTCEF